MRITCAMSSGQRMIGITGREGFFAHQFRQSYGT